MITLRICAPLSSEHLLPDHHHPVDQPARLLAEDNMITVVPIPDSQVSLHPPLLLLVHARSNPVVHMLDVWLQSRLVRGRRDRSTLDLEINFFSSLTIYYGNRQCNSKTSNITQSYLAICCNKLMNSTLHYEDCHICSAQPGSQACLPLHTA